MTRATRLRTELAAATRLAAPVALTQLGMMLMGVVDTMMLGHLSAEALAAGALGHVITITVLILGYGVLNALDPLIAQAYGAGDAAAIGGHLQRGFVMAAVLTVPFTLLLLDVEPVLLMTGQPPGVSAQAASYIRGILWGGLPYFIFVVLRQTLQAMSFVRPAAIAIVIGNVVNGIANWALIYGNLGMPALGVRGSAYATSLSRLVMFAYLLWAARRLLAPYWRGFTAEAFRGHRLMLRIGIPIGLHNAAELLIFTAAALLLGRIGVHELAGHQVAINLASVSFMVPLGISGAAATRVGNAIGRGDMPAARRAAAVCLFLGAAAMSFFALLFAVLPGPLAGLYTEDPAVLRVVLALLPIAAMFQIFDGLQVVGAGVLRGAADTTFPAVVVLIGYWVLGLPVGWHLAFDQGMGARGLWWGFTVALLVMAVLFLLRIAVRFRGDLRRVGEARA